MLKKNIYLNAFGNSINRIHYFERNVLNAVKLHTELIHVIFDELTWYVNDLIKKSGHSLLVRNLNNTFFIKCVIQAVKESKQPSKHTHTSTKP